MNEHQARELESLLSWRVPGGEVTVTPQEDGARVVIDAYGEIHMFSVRNGPSVLLNHLLTGYPD